MFATGYLPLTKRLPDLDCAVVFRCLMMDSPNLLQKPGVCFPDARFPDAPAKHESHYATPAGCGTALQ